MHLDKATTRRKTYLEAKKARLATHHENIKNALEAYRSEQDMKERLEGLLDRLAKAHGNRDRLLKVVAETCGRRVELAKKKARQVKKERDEEARVASRDILLRLESAEKRREELLSARGGRSSWSSSRKNDVVQRSEAAIRIQRAWRRYQLVRAVKEFVPLDITIESITALPFEQVVDKFRAPATVNTTSRLLSVLGLIKPSLSDKEGDSLVRTFLSAYMILGHTQEVLHSHDQPLQLVPPIPPPTKFQDLTSKAHTLLTLLERHNRLLISTPLLRPHFTSYLTAFQSWKSHDSPILVELLVSKFVDLDGMLQDIQSSPTMQSVLEEYTQAIKSGQMLLLAKIRRLVGDETRNIVRRAVQAARRRRREVVPVRDQVQEDSVQVEIIEPPRMNVGLSNREMMHELALDPEYEITLPQKSEEEQLREELFKKTFYDGLLSSLRGGDMSLIPGIVGDIKSRLLSLLQPSTPSYNSLSEQLDGTIIAQECQRNLFDMEKFTRYVIGVMRQLCAPIRDDDIASISSLQGNNINETFVLRVQRIMEVLGLMALDSANFHLRIAKPTLLPQATAYERTKFAEDLEKGNVTLEKTTKWLETAAQRELSNASSSSNPSSIWRNAFIDILFSSDELPETLGMDIGRISTLRSQISSVVTIAATLLLAKTFSAGNTSRNIDFAQLAQRLKVLSSESVENIVLEVERFIGPLKRDLLSSMIRRVRSGEGDPCVSILERRVRSILDSILSGGEISKAALSGMGLGDVETEIREIIRMAGKVGKVNWACYREFYQDIIKAVHG